MFQLIYDSFGFHGYLMVPFAFAKVKVHEFSDYLALGEDFFEAFAFHRLSKKLSDLEKQDLQNFLALNSCYKDLFTPQKKNELSHKPQKLHRSGSLSKSTVPPKFSKRRGSFDEGAEGAFGNRPKLFQKFNDSDLFDSLCYNNLLDNFLYLSITNRLKFDFFHPNLKLDLKLLLLQR